MRKHAHWCWMRWYGWVTTATNCICNTMVCIVILSPNRSLYTAVDLFLVNHHCHPGGMGHMIIIYRQCVIILKVADRYEELREKKSRQAATRTYWQDAIENMTSPKRALGYSHCNRDDSEPVVGWLKLPSRFTILNSGTQAPTNDIDWPFSILGIEFGSALPLRNQ